MRYLDLKDGKLIVVSSIEIIKKDGIYEISNDESVNDFIVDNGQIRKLSESEIFDKSQSKLAQTEYSWSKPEIESITEELEKHADNSSRAIATEQEWRDYREALRNYATVDDDGVYSLRTEKPVRPS